MRAFSAKSFTVVFLGLHPGIELDLFDRHLVNQLAAALPAYAYPSINRIGAIPASP